MTAVYDDKGRHFILYIPDDDVLYIKDVLEWAQDHYLENLMAKGEDYTRFKEIRAEIIGRVVKQLEGINDDSPCVQMEEVK